MHEAVIELVQDFLDRQMFTGDFPTLLVASFVLSTLVAGVSYVVVERPALRLKDRPWRRRTRDPEPART